jgi:hypothetical protein
VQGPDYSGPTLMHSSDVLVGIARTALEPLFPCFRCGYKCLLHCRETFATHRNRPQSSVGTAMDYGLDGWDSIPGRGKKFFSTAFRSALGPTQLPIQWVPQSLSPRVKHPGREADGSPPSSVISNGGATPTLSNTFSWRGA